MSECKLPLTLIAIMVTIIVVVEINSDAPFSPRKPKMKQEFRTINEHEYIQTWEERKIGHKPYGLEWEHSRQCKGCK